MISKQSIWCDFDRIYASDLVHQAQAQSAPLGRCDSMVPASNTCNPYATEGATGLTAHEYPHGVICSA